MTAVKRPVLVCVSGLPATGKSTICQLVVAAFGWPYVRVDTVETAITRAEGDYEATNGWVCPPGYEVAYDSVVDRTPHNRLVCGRRLVPLKDGDALDEPRQLALLLQHESQPDG